MAEFLIVMREGATNEQRNGVIEAVQARKGRVEVSLPPRVIIGKTRQACQDFEAALREQGGVSTVYTAPVRDPERLELDRASLSAVKAWNLRQSPEYRSAKEARRGKRLPLDYGNGRGDIVPVEEIVLRSLPPSCRNTSRYMLGTVAVGVIVVNGPAGTAASFTLTELELVDAEVQEGMDLLIQFAPVDPNSVPRINFIIDKHTVPLNLQPNNVTSEGAWRDSAMATLGYSAGDSGMYDYLHDLRTTKWPMCPGPDWAYIAFFTKYWVDPNYPAYAQRCGPRLVIPYDDTGARGGYRVSDIDYLFAHETGHIFGAPDEYASLTCPPSPPDKKFGYLGERNANCEEINLTPAPCLMSFGPDFGNQICQHTVAHFGWRDSDSNNLPDPIDPAGLFGTDVGITPGTPFWNNADLWIRNQDDGEANPSHQNPRSNIDNYIYARVRNFGGVPAEIVRVSFYLANYTGTEFVFPNDYTNVISAPDTPCPTLFCLDPDGSQTAKVHLRPAQIPPTTWDPCLLVHVSCAQDLPVQAGSHVWDSNNLAQKNLVIDYVAPAQTLSLPLMAQNASAQQPFFEFRSKRVPDAAEIVLQFRDPHFRPEVIESDNVTPVERVGLLFLPLTPNRIAKFKLPLRPRTRKTIGLSFTVPREARIGDEYRFELIQSNEHRQPTGGITFAIRVVNPSRVLNEQRWRTTVLRELGRHLQNPRFSALADAADTLIESQFDQDGETTGDPAKARVTFSRILREIAVPDIWGYPVEALIEMDERIRIRPGLVTDLDALSLVLFYAQERLLVEHETQ